MAQIKTDGTNNYHLIRSLLNIGIFLHSILPCVASQESQSSHGAHGLAH